MDALPVEVTKRIHELFASCDPTVATTSEFRGHQFDLGLAWLHFPRGAGGLALTRDVNAAAQSRMRALGAPGPGVESIIGLGMGAPTLIGHGSADLLDRHLRRLFTGDEIWCQLFSEPGAGSDLAGVSTSATRVEGGWVINGQKVWTSYGHIADWGMLLARTDPTAPKHKGLTFFLVEMTAPGVEVRPLYQITGDAEFNEVYLTDVFVPDEHRVGRPGDGWAVALTTLANERSTLSDGEAAVDPLGDVLRAWHEHGWDDPVMADRVVALWLRAALAEMTIRRITEEAVAGKPGPEGSLGKLLWAECAQDLTELSLLLLGEEAIAYERGYPLRPTPETRELFDDVRWTYLRTRANSIEGGTSEIMRNIIGERVLGLPAEPRLDKGVPWLETRRG